MIKSTVIKLGRGLGDILFGISKDDLENLIGEADFEESFENENPDLGESHVWHYNDTNLSFTFEELDNFKLGMISVNTDQYTLRDSIRIGQEKQHVLDLLEELNMTEYAQEDHSNEDNPDHTLVTIDEKSLYLWFDAGKLSEIQWFPFYDGDDEIIWPA